jgi:HEAT repeat protein
MTQPTATAAHQLGLWIARAQGDELQRACLTGVHAAGSLKTSLSALLSGEGKAAQRCLSKEPELKKVLWVELYSEDGAIRREALTHLARAFERPAARVVLDALPTHPPAFDELILESLASFALEENVSPAASLMAAAGPGDVEAMNRVLGVFARQRDAAKPDLSSSELPVRRQALSKLAGLAPLSEPELLGALSDPVPAHRLAAARGLARGESRSLAAMMEARLSGAKPATQEQQLVLLALVGDAHEADCAPIVLRSWRDAARAPELRSRALVVAASCSWAEASADVEAALQAPGLLERSSAVLALGFAPKSEQLNERLLRASSAQEAGVRKAACQSIAQQRWRGGIAGLTLLLKDAEPEVRAEAMRTLVALDAPSVDKSLIAALEKDPSPVARSAAADLLGRFLGARVIAVLSQASRNDTDPNVKLVAAQSLRKLQAGSPSP